MMIKIMSLVFLCLSSVVALIDGIYLHIFKLNLHYHLETRYEHLLHSLRALLFTLITIVIFYYQASGLWLYLGISLFLFDFVIEIVDIREEDRSRKAFGGLANYEYLLHSLAMTFRSLAIGLWLSQLTSVDFSLANTSLIAREGYLKIIVEQILYPSFVITIVHFVLMFKPFYIKPNFFRCCKI